MSVQSVSALVDDKATAINRQVFIDTDVYELEQRRIFDRCWLYLGHSSQLRQRGDFITAWMGETPVILVKGYDDRLYGHINSCSHRGLRVCRNDRGSAKVFVCPYHNWSYALNGELLTVPQERLCQNKVAKKNHGLQPIPRIDSYEGLIFGSLDPDIESLDDYLGDMRFYLDTFFKRFPAGVEVLEPVHKWRLSANWKLPVENQHGDIGHAPYLHSMLFKDNPALEEIDQFGYNTVPKPGHAAAVRLMPEGLPATRYMWGEYALSMETDSEVLDYLLDVQSRIEDRLGPVSSRLKGLAYGIFPNCNLLWQNSTLRVSHPRGPGSVEYWSWCFVPTDAPESVRRFTRQCYSGFFGPGGAVEQEDSEAWSEQYSGNRIAILNNRPYFYGLGAGEETTHPLLPGLVGSCYNELYCRQFYLRWRAELTNGSGVAGT